MSLLLEGCGILISMMVLIFLGGVISFSPLFFALWAEIREKRKNTCNKTDLP